MVNQSTTFISIVKAFINKYDSYSSPNRVNQDNIFIVGLSLSYKIF